MTTLEALKLLVWGVEVDHLMTANDPSLVDAKAAIAEAEKTAKPFVPVPAGAVRTLRKKIAARPPSGRCPAISQDGDQCTRRTGHSRMHRHYTRAGAGRQYKLTEWS